MSNKTRKKQIENQAQQGRSMVEMLGVLAIIGVLSIGGIAGYRMAMNRHQANQIANEINLMRTDAKMKVARGVDELLLGEPYDGDDGHLNFGSNYGVDFDFIDIKLEDSSETESGYFIKVSGVPAGVCKPLVTLLDNMDDAIAVVVNEQENNADSSADLCTEESNALEVDFSTKGLGGGSGNPEVTDPEQADEPQDDDPVPEECPRGTTLSDDGSECTCEETEKTCNGGCCAGCTGGKVWTGKKCACPAGAVESGDDGEDCVCSTATPYWDGTKCTICPEGSQPQDGKCVCSSDTSKEWKASLENGGCDKERVGECQKNSDCGLGEYCYLYWGNGCGNDKEFQSGKFGAGYSSYKGKCRNARGDIDKEGTDGKFVLGKATADNTDSSGGYMDWWSAERFCEALGRPRAKRESIGCGEVSAGSTCTSETLTALRNADFSGTVWLEDRGNSCGAYYVTLCSGDVNFSNPANRSALCE